MDFSVRSPVRDFVHDLNAIGDIQSIAVTPATPTVITTQQMVATATMEDGSTRVITTQAGIVWASSDPTKGTVSAAGLVTGVLDGTTIISATFGGISGSTVATVNVA